MQYLTWTKQSHGLASQNTLHNVTCTFYSLGVHNQFVFDEPTCTLKNRTFNPPGRGTQIWFWQGFAARASKPLPENFGKTDPCLGIFFLENGTHVLGFLVKKRSIRAAHPGMPLYVSAPFQPSLLSKNCLTLWYWFIVQIWTWNGIYLARMNTQVFMK